MRPLVVALGQIRSTTDPLVNLGAVAGTVRAAARRGATLIVLPEAAMCRFDADPRRVAQPLDGPFVGELVALAGESGATLVVGLFETPAPRHDGDDRVFNTVVVVEPGGQVHPYRKIHLFDAPASRESDTIVPGRDVTIVDLPGFRLGVATCFDLRFAAQFEALRAADVVAVPASWAAGPRKVDQWRDLTAVRAMDSQAWLLAADQAGVESPLPLGVGHSRIVDPWGEPVAEAGADEQLLVATVDLDRVREARRTLPLASLS